MSIPCMPKDVLAVAVDAADSVNAKNNVTEIDVEWTIVRTMRDLPFPLFRFSQKNVGFVVREGSLAPQRA